MLTLKNISKKFGNQPVLKNITAEFLGGLNFIIGPSGSGKSTLLKIISGMDPMFDGEVYFNNKSIKQFSKSELNHYYYNSIGFIWQNFQLINHLSVEDNVMVVLGLSNLDQEAKRHKVESTLQKLGLQRLAKHNVKSLSGGEKQRVAIARALVKDPEIIIADEPTGALDKNNTKALINTLKQIAKERMVIIVTHDQSLIDDDSNAFVLKDGELVHDKKRESMSRKSLSIKKNPPILSAKNTLSQSIKNVKGMLFKTILTSIVLVLASYFLLLNVSGEVTNQGNKAMNHLVKQYGQSLFNISVVSEMLGGAGMGGSEDANSPNRDVKQDISSIFKDYQDDKRIEAMYPIATINKMEVTIEGVTDHLQLEQSNTVPVNNGLLAGRMPDNDQEEVVVPKAFLSKIDVTPEKVLNKEIEITGTMFVWNQDVPEEKSHTLNLKIVGVIDSTMKIDNAMTGEKMSIENEDSFIYSKKAVEEFNQAIGKDNDKTPLEMRATTLPNVLSLVKELQGKGIVPIGQFMMVKDISELNATTDHQSNSISYIMGALAIIMTTVLTVMNTIVRKKEYAILKMNGFSIGHITKLTMVENAIISVLTMVLFFVVMPLVNKFSMALFQSSLINQQAILVAMVIIVSLGLLMTFIASFLIGRVQPMKSLQSGGDR
ncbi:ABC transporter ATP-binding protein/permease [Lysinibacillus cavernae]|uniref:ABC transporter ATP-binding protein/permease n=1 Tax=Lysinibacillus cavernae TaxID=2666135 RepID=UPI0018C1EF3C|nr:ABC transporter ATP-binding protein/permease [Lysinibacillus cavernae]